MNSLQNSNIRLMTVMMVMAMIRMVEVDGGGDSEDDDGDGKDDDGDES